MDFDIYDPARDRDAARRIWRETGWLEEGKEEPMDAYVNCGRALVMRPRGEAEVLTITCPGTMRYLDEELPLSCVTGVTTSRVARKQGFAKKLTAAAVALDAEDGAAVSALGMFEQGYYDKLGFGTGVYENWLAFDPATLRVPVRAAAPERVGMQDWRKAHAARLNRQPCHGRCNLTPAETTQADMLWTPGGFGLGYSDGDELTHYLWMSGKEAEQGPYRVAWMSYRTGAQLLELLALVRDLGDQVRLVKMREPAGIQLQDLIDKPFLHMTVTSRSRFENKFNTSAYWQMRMNDVVACLSRTHLRCADLEFNCTLTDPIDDALDRTFAWRGCGGDYVITLGKQAAAARGVKRGFPHLKASIGAFTRMWLGVQPASALSLSDQLAGPDDLLNKLDWALRIPRPHPDWDF